MTDRHPIDDPELDAVPADAEDEEEAGLYEHFAVTADKGQTPMRLDKFLTVRMEHCSRNRIQAAADSGNILVNGKAAKSSYKVKPLDRIQIVMPYPRREVEPRTFRSTSPTRTNGCCSWTNRPDWSCTRGWAITAARWSMR